MAAFMQSWRNAFQKRLSTDVDTMGVTLSRFILAVPMAAIYAFILFKHGDTPIPHLGFNFYIIITLAAFLPVICATIASKK